MKNTKRSLVRDVAQKIEKLPEDKRQYVLGIMDGIMISSGNTRRETVDEDEPEKAVRE